MLAIIWTAAGIGWIYAAKDWYYAEKPMMAGLCIFVACASLFVGYTNL